MSTSVQQLTPLQVSRSDSAQWKQIVKQALDDARCASPAFLTEDIDAGAQTVTVQLAIQERVRTSKGAQWWDVPPIINVPLVLPRGGGWALTLPLKKGDEGLLVFCDTCFDNWWANGATGPKAQNLSAAQPASGSQRQLEVRRHYVHDCGFIPGMCSQPNKMGSYSTSSMQLRKDDGSVVIDLADGGVTITGPLTEVKAAGGTPLALVNDNFYQWFVAVYMPSVRYVTTAPPLPLGPETTVLKGQ